MPRLKIGTRVQRLHPCDGSACSGMAYGPVLVVKELRDHAPCDGSYRKNAIAVLSSGNWEFVWNVRPLPVKED